MLFELSIAHGCPIDCSCCPQDKIQAAYEGPRLMTMEVFRRCLSQAPVGSIVSFAGFAEPYLNPHATEMILAAIDSGRQVQLYTTCVGMTVKDVWDLADEQFKILCVHLPDSSGVAKIDATKSYLAVVYAITEAFPDAELMTLGQLHPSVSYLRPRLKNTFIHSRAGNVSGMTQIRKSGPLRCSQNAEIKDNVILPNGDVVLCCNDWSMQHVLGNLMRQTFDEIHAGENVAGVKAAMKEGDCLCRSCEFAVGA